MPDPKVINDSDDFVPMPTPDRVLGPAESDGLDPLPFQFNDIRALAQKILKRAQEQGQQKIEAARKQVAAMEKQAYDKAYKEAFSKGREEGFAKGEKEGMASAGTKIAAAVESEKVSLVQNSEPARNVLEQLAGVMNENRQHLLAQAEGDLLLLALDIARRLVARELTVDPEAVRPLAVECIGMVTDRSGVTVRVNPEDYRVMNEIVPDLKAIFPDLGAVAIEPDPGVERGGMLAATREAEVDMRLSTRLAAFEDAMLGFSGERAVAPWNAIPPAAPDADREPPALAPGTEAYESSHAPPAQTECDGRTAPDAPEGTPEHAEDVARPAHSFRNEDGAPPPAGSEKTE